MGERAIIRFLSSNGFPFRARSEVRFPPSAPKEGRSAAQAEFWNAADDSPLLLSICERRTSGGIAGQGEGLTLAVNSAARADRGKELILEELGDLLKPPLTGLRTVDQLMAEPRTAPQAQAIPPDIARKIAHEHLDRHYRDALDQPIPALGNKTSRQAVRSAAGRRKVVEWLKLIENRSASQTGSPLAE